MAAEDALNEYTRLASNSHKKASTFTGTVTEITGNTCTVEFENDAPFYEVRLNVIVDEVENSITILPKVNSAVIVSLVDGLETEAYVAQCSEIDGVRVIIGTVEFTVTSAGVTVKKGTDSLKDVFTLMIQAVMKIVVLYGEGPDYDKLTQALTKIQNILV